MRLSYLLTIYHTLNLDYSLFVPNLRLIQSGLFMKVPTSPEKVFVITDIGRDPDDMLAFVLARSLADEGFLKIVGAIATLTPSSKRMRLAHHTKDNIGLDSFLIGTGSDLPTLGPHHVHPYEFEQLPDLKVPHIDAPNALEKVLQNSEDCALTILVIAAFTDLAKFLQKSSLNQELFNNKVKQTVIMGGVEESCGYLVPDSSANYQFDPESAEYVLRFLQKSQIPMIFVSRYAAYAAKLDRELFEEMGSTGHPIGVWLQSVARKVFESLWERANLPLDNPSRALPERCDAKWFVDSFREGKDPLLNNVWKSVRKVCTYDPLAMLTCSPTLLEEFFEPVEISVNGVKSNVIGLSKDKPGLKKPKILTDFLHDRILAVIKEHAYLT